MSTLRLRDYQTECIDAVFAAWDRGVKRPAVVLPTGAGKTVVFSALVKRWRQHAAGTGGWFPDYGRRVIVLAHRDELVDQAIAKLRATLPEGVSVGKVKAEDNDIDADVMVCSVQTLASAHRRRKLVNSQYDRIGADVGLIITDECHHAAAQSYRKVYDAFPDTLQLGVTATLARGDQRGLGDVWDEVVYTKSVLWMQSRGYLCDVEGKAVKTSVDMSDVKVSRGDYQAADLGKAMLEAEVHKPIAAAYVEHAKDRQGVVFTPTVATAEAAAEELNRAGVRTAVITGSTPREERLRVFEDYRQGRVQALANCMVLTEGFDAPWAEVAVIARPTQSQPLYIQMVGRVLRPWPGKERALVLDMVGASSGNKLRTLVDLEPDFVKDVREGETLREAAERAEEEGNAPVPGVGKFELRAKDVSLFGGSDHVWGRTPKGVMYLNTGDGYVFLWPSADGGWDVCSAAKGEKWRKTPHVGLDLSMAMAWAESTVEDFAVFTNALSAKSARWRKAKPSDAQISYAERLGIPTAGMSKGALSEAIDAVQAARFFDRYVTG